MTKQEFLRELERLLQSVTPSERKEMLYDYEEHIRSAMENGSTEEEAVASLGNPRTIARELLATAYVQQAADATSVKSVLRAVLAVIGLGFFNLIVVLGPFIAIAAVLFALYVVSFSFIAGPIAGFIGLALGTANLGVMSPLMAIFLLLTMEGVGLLMGVGMIAITKVFGTLCVQYLKLNLRVIKGGQ